jgi:hypothetical protein
MNGARANVLLAIIALLACESMAIASSEMLARAKDLYRNAAYDEALVVLDEITVDAASPDRVEAREFRLFCQIALGRTDEARATIESLLAADPFYQLTAAQASPRVRALFNEVRQVLLPEIVQRAYADARAAFANHDPKSTVSFDRVIELLDDPDLASRPAFADLRVVTLGFRDLSKAFAPAAPPVPVPAPAPAAVVASQPPRSPSKIVYREGDAGVIAPVPLSQKLPPFIQRGFQAREITGGIELLIDENGNVISATVSTSIRPDYDRQLVEAAMLWKYRPGRKDDKPVLVRKFVAVRIQSN